MQFQHKIDPDGRYLRFPGVTVVSAIRDGDLPAWQSVYSDMAVLPLVTDHYSLLPAESYHMTTADLFTFRDHGQALIEQNLPMLRQIHGALIEHAYQPRIVIESFSVLPNVCRLNLAFSQEQQAINRAIFARFDLLNRIPPVFHITLGYSYKPTDQALRERIAEALGAKFTCVGKSFILDRPKLCYFDDMLAFIPWDVAEMPWKKESDK